MARYNIPNMYIANKMRDASDAALTARVSALETNVTTLETMSTSERVVGKWIDGRDIYEKVLDLGDLPTSTTSPNNSKEVSHNISDVDIFINVGGFMYGPDGENNVLTGNLPFAPSPDALAHTVTLIANRTIVRVAVGYVRTGFKAYAILRYVKVVTPSNNKTTKKGGKN